MSFLHHDYRRLASEECASMTLLEQCGHILEQEHSEQVMYRREILNWFVMVFCTSDTTITFGTESTTAGPSWTDSRLTERRPPIFRRHHTHLSRP